MAALLAFQLPTECFGLDRMESEPLLPFDEFTSNDMQHSRATTASLVCLILFGFHSQGFSLQPVRKFDAPEAPPFVRLDAKPGLKPPVDINGNFLIGPEYAPAPERKVKADVPKGKLIQFTIDSRDTKLLNPGIARKVFGKVDPKNPKTLIVDTHEIDYKRQITVS